MEASYELSFILVSLQSIFQALPVTLELTFVPLLAGLVFGIPFAVIRRFRVRFAASFLKYLAAVIKGIPAILLVLMTNYLVLKPIDYLAQTYEFFRPLQQMNKIYIGIAALSVYAVVQVTETMVSALQSVNEGQYEAAYSIGMTKLAALRRIIFPQAFPMALPMLCNNIIGLLKTTSIVYLISVNDILGAAMNSAAVNFRYLEAYIAAAIVYWGMCAAVEWAFGVLERRFRRAAGGTA